ncbi:MAG: CocE/NonD family hydrolase [Candidatus Thermoplasmatota archaeon]
MRILLVCSILLASLLAGCGSGGNDESGYVVPLVPADIVIPAVGNASLEAIEQGLALVWDAVTLPHAVEVTVPEHATMVRAVADSGATSVSMTNLETGRRRCNNPTVEDFSSGFGYPKSCSSIAALDVPGAVWRVNFAGSGKGDVRVEFLAAPYDGLLAGLDLSQIDPPTRDLQDTIVEFIPSHDGILLRTERTLPQGSGPFPAVIVSSPYYSHAAGADPADWTYVVQDWARRGYAMVTADVRGFADSGGCVEVWGINEQLDQKFLVEWVAAQPWSDGNVGFYGQSYVGTTPVEAAVQAPPALKAIVTIAPVINAYEDWHYGGVPNGESTLSPLAYQVLTESLITEGTNEVGENGRYLNDPEQLLNNAKNGPCDPTLVPMANDPRGVYNAFYEERNFKLRAKDVTAAVLYTEGFEDANVKAAMIPGWFNELQSPKLGLFGHWLHQHPSRLDCEALFVGWFETHLKGKDLGFDALPPVAVQVDRDTHRTASEWPPTSPLVSVFGADIAAGTLAEGTGSTDDTVTLMLDHAGAGATVPDMPNTITYTMTLARDVSLAGVGLVPIHGVLAGANAYVAAYVYEGDRLVTWGQLNLAHNDDHTQYTPYTPLVNQDVTRSIPLRPTEDILRAGSELRVTLRGVQAAEATDPFGAMAPYLNLDSIGLQLPGVDLADYESIPLTARP